jgi:hypothetical protein
MYGTRFFASLRMTDHLVEIPAFATVEEINGAYPIIEAPDSASGTNS